MSPFRRAVTAVSATALACAALVGAAAPASADSGECDFDTSTRLVTAEGRQYRVWIDRSQYSPTTYVCFRFGNAAGGALRIDGTGGLGAPPAVTYDLAYTGCPDVVDVEDPVHVVVRAGALGWGHDVCVGFGGSAVSLKVSLASLDFDSITLTLDSDTIAGSLYCTVAALCPYGYAEIEIL